MSKPQTDFQPEQVKNILVTDFSDTTPLTPLTESGRGCVLEVFGGDTVTLIVEFVDGTEVTYSSILPEYYQFPFRVRAIRATGSTMPTKIIAGY